MPELTAAAVQQYTSGRLVADNAETGRLLVLALRAARAFCEWHVTPVLDEQPFTINGSGSRLLRLPTLQLVELHELYQHGTAIDVSQLDVHAGDEGTRGRMIELPGHYWSGRMGAITGKMTHGYDAAPEFDAAVLSLLDRVSYAPAGGRARVIGPIQYDAASMRGIWSEEEQGYLGTYKLSWRP